MGDGALRGKRLLRLVSREAEEEGWSGEEGSAGMKGNTVTSGHLLSSVSPSMRGVQCILSESTPGQKAGRKPIKRSKGDVLYMQSIVLLSSPDGVSPKKPISSDNGSKREQAGSAADGCISNSPSAEQTLFKVPPTASVSQ